MSEPNFHTETESAESCFRSCSACCHSFWNSLLLCFQYWQNENCKYEQIFQETSKNSEVESIFETSPNYVWSKFKTSPTRLTTFHNTTEKLKKPFGRLTHAFCCHRTHLFKKVNCPLFFQLFGDYFFLYIGAGRGLEFEKDSSFWTCSTRELVHHKPVMQHCAATR